MRVYRYLLGRLVYGLGLIFVFTLMCFLLWCFYLRVSGPPIFITIWPNPFQENPWFHFWYYPPHTLNEVIEYFVFYISHMMTGEYGISFSEGFRSVSELIFFRLPYSLEVCLAPFLFVVMVWAGWKVVKNINRWRGEDHFSQRTLGHLMLLIVVFVIAGVMAVYVLQFGVVPRLRMGFEFWSTSIILLFVVMNIGILIIRSEINNQEPGISLQEQSSRRVQLLIKDIPSVGILVALVWTMVLSSLIIIETGLHSYGFGRLLFEASMGHNLLVLNAVFFLMGLSVILVLVVSEVCFGLWRFGSLRLRRTK